MDGSFACMQKCVLDRISDISRSILDAESISEIRHEAESIYSALGFEIFAFGSYDTVTQLPVCSYELTTWTAEFLKLYEQDFHHFDSLSGQAAQTRKPVLWRTGSRDSRASNRSIIEILNGEGINSGLIMPLCRVENALHGVVLNSKKDQYPTEKNLIAALGVSSLLCHKWLSTTAPSNAIEAKSPAGSGVDDLSDFQKEILHWIAQGKSNSDISVILGVSRRKIDYHVAKIFNFLRVSSRSQAATFIKYF
jgi:DNA-binding CsgD family transcriptional regulator